jgi:hypothetical protein
MSRRTVVDVPRGEIKQVEQDETGRPQIFKVGAMLTSLDRMIEHREQRLEEGTDSQGVLGYYSKELKALRASKAALLYHRATIERLPHFVDALRRVVAEVPANSPLPGLRAAREQAQSVLDEYGHLAE